MNFNINKDSVIVIDGNDWPGVARVAGKVAGDFKLVFGSGKDAETVSFAGDVNSLAGKIVAGCIGKSAIIDALEKDGLIDLSQVRGKNEVYLFTVVEISGQPTLVIAGSDKRGTIYGLFHISDLMEVSPWVWFADVSPAKKESVVVSDKDILVSKEPSVKYRGFFINDEWPSYGNWTTDNFGGFNARMYDHVFELLLRMKGNYMWPAMWSSCFSDDGPGIENARLADEYGVVMGTSHHEPCMRQGEEFSHVKGPDSIYGNDWNFNRNREGLINFWRDGLKRNAPFEDIVTVGMRGEADSEMLGRECTTLDNINYLKDVITTQQKLIEEVHGDKASEIKKVFAVYKEVEKFYYGDEENEGLRTWEGLDGTIILLSDDNHGNMRLLPPACDRDHNGGFGMYYHLDYHGGPVSFEWVNSSYIATVAEQMGQAYECGVKDLWIVNVGDIKPVEFPLNYFMDLAYDYDKWSTEYPEYTKAWAEKQFGKAGKESVSEAVNLLEDYTRINSVRRPETISPFSYSPVYFDEGREMLAKAGRVIAQADAAFEKFKGTDLEDAFFQLVYFPAKASMNLLTMQLYSGLNKVLAKAGCPSANYFSEGIKQCYALDRELEKEYNALGGGKWKGMMLSEHIGFINWNEEEHMVPTREYVIPYENDRVCVSVTGSAKFTMGGDWTKKELLVYDLLIPGSKGEIRAENCCGKDAEWKAETDCDWIVLSETAGKLKGAADENNLSADGPDSSVVYITVTADADKLHAACAGKETAAGYVNFSSGRNKTKIKVVARDFTEEELKASHYVPVLPEDVAVPAEGISLCCAIEAADFEKINSGKECDFRVYAPYGKYESGLRVYPTDGGNKDPKDMPSADYSFYLPESGECEIILSEAPGGPVFKETLSSLALAVNGGEIVKVPMVNADYKAGENSSAEWCNVALVHEKVKSVKVNGVKGKNTLTVYGYEPGAVLMRMVIRSARGNMTDSFFGPVPGFVLS
ncbi:MAG: glycosyl hydrolase 115 family protein [Lachnospiraceae bacterium]|nr:glycosyl hydrolase 115 family protein [Lachnospiraceae bacterium]